MTGEFKIIGKDCYLIMNKGGTLQKFPRLKWYQIIYLAVKNYLKGYVHMKDIEALVKH